MAIDLKISHKMIRIIIVYLLHAGYDSNYFQSTLDDVERLIMEACDKRYAVVIGGDFNLSLDQGVRDRLLQDLCAEFSLDIANGTPLAEILICKLLKHLGAILIDWIMFSIPDLCNLQRYLQISIWIWAQTIAMYQFLCHILDPKKLGNYGRDRSRDGSLL